MTIKFPRFTMLFLGLLIAAALIGSVELALRFLAPTQVAGLTVENVSSRGGAANSEGRNWTGWALSGYSLRFWHQGNIVAFSDVNFDEFGRRVVPQTNSEPKQKHLIFIGGSLAFGDGVNDAETLPAFYAAKAPNARVYNYGIPGGGPNQFAFQLENEQFFGPEAVPERSGTLVYLFYDRYLSRTVNSASLFMYWGDRPMPSYKLNESGQAEFEGDFRQAHPWRAMIYSVIAKSAIFRYLHLDYPFFPERLSYQMVTAMIEYTKGQYLRQFPGGRFVVLFYPQKTLRSAGRLLPILRARGIETVDYSRFERLFPRDDPKYWIPHHDHSTKQMNKEFAAILYKDLNQTAP